MKKIVLLSCWLCVQLLVAQQPEYATPENILRTGQQMYADRNYVGCIVQLNRLKEVVAASDNRELVKEADFLLLASAFRLGELKNANAIEAYIKTEPQSIHSNELYFMMADVLFTKKKVKAATTWLSKSEMDDLPKEYQKRYSFYVGILQLQAGQYEAAEQQFTPLAGDPVFQQDLPYYMAQIAFAKGDYAAVVRQLQPLVSKNSTAFSPEDYARLGISFYMQDNYQEAIRYLEKAQNLERSALKQNVLLALGLSFVELGNTNKALPPFELAARMNFDRKAKEVAMYNHAILFHSLPSLSLDESMAVLENFINAFPESQYAEMVYDALIDAYLTSKEYDAALVSIEKIQHPSDKLLQVKQQLLFYLGTTELTNDRHDEAIDYFKQAIAVGNYADKAPAIYWLAESYFRKGDFASATKGYKEYLQLPVTSYQLPVTSYQLVAGANYGLGYCAFKRKDYTQAESYFKAFIAKEKNDKNMQGDAYARLGDCYFEKRRFKEAETAYSQAEKLAPASADYTLFQKGYVLGLQKDYRGKVEQMDALIRRSPQSPYLAAALYEKGRAQVMLHDDNAAISTYQSLLTRFPDAKEAPKAGLEIGLLHYNAANTQQALAAYKQVVSKYPDSEEAKVALQDLKSVYFDANDIAGYADYVRTLDGMVTFDAEEQEKLTYLAAEQLLNEKKYQKAQQALESYLKNYPQGAFKSEAYHYLASILFEQKQHLEAIEAINTFIEQESPNTYWLAKSFILLSDIYVAEGDIMQARQYLESLQTNYPNKHDDILQIVEGRLKKLPEGGE
ncbi:hypothetical protein AGMMS49982_20390 [Bacteroidia bacterium]|nr:hypothetical protein AGMMS49982_20390 [Bacteroidia bacterium]